MIDAPIKNKIGNNGVGGTVLRRKRKKQNQSIMLSGQTQREMRSEIIHHIRQQGGNLSII